MNPATTPERPPKPPDCDCAYPIAIARNLTLHAPDCPAYERIWTEIVGRQSPQTGQLLDGDETAVLNTLAQAWNQFFLLERLHPTERQEFMDAIHRAQHIIMARPVMRTQRLLPEEANE